MKILRIEYLIRKGPFGTSRPFEKLLSEVERAILSVTWPPESNSFTIYPGRKANGVAPIKRNCMRHLKAAGWNLEDPLSIASRIRPGPVDALKKIQDAKWFAVEWETGNISSSHRAMNKFAIGLIDGILMGGILILPSRRLYDFLTDRIGNFSEIEPYFPLWRSINVDEGVLAIIEVEHDDVSMEVPTIRKGTDGRALG